MGNGNQNNVQSAINTEKQRSLNAANEGIVDEQNRTQQLIGRSDDERSAVWSGYSGLANDPNGGISQTDEDRLLGRSSSGSGSSGGGGGGGGVSGVPDYLQTFYEMQGKTGGFDPTRLNNITDVSGKLRNAKDDYGATDTSIKGLQDFAATGGVSADNISKIDNPTLEEFSRTGGYSDADKANIRARSNAGIASTYANLKQNLNTSALRNNNIGPGYSSAGFKLARQGAQDIGTQAQNTEANIAEAVRQGRMDASTALADKMLSLSNLQSQNTLSGYTNSGQLDETKQKQIEDALASSGNLDLNTQEAINQARLAATSGISQDTLGRMSISSAAASARAAIDAANNRFLIAERDQNRATGLGGMLDTYKAAPTELLANQNLLLNYRGMAGDQQNNLIKDQIAAGSMPSTGSAFGNFLGNLGNLTKMMGGGMGGGNNGGNNSFSDYGPMDDGSGDLYSYNPIADNGGHIPIINMPGGGDSPLGSSDYYY